MAPSLISSSSRLAQAKMESDDYWIVSWSMLKHFIVIILKMQENNRKGFFQART